MLNLILMLISLAFGNNNANTSSNNNSNDNGQSTTQLADPRTGTDPGDGTGGPVGGNSGQLPPPPFTQP